MLYCVNLKMKTFILPKKVYFFWLDIKVLKYSSLAFYLSAQHNYVVSCHSLCPFYWLYSKVLTFS